MAGRPLKSGVDYWPFDVGLLYDDKIKLIRGEFGAKGVLIALFALNSCYKNNGYYRVWSDDDAILLAEEVGCGCSFGLVQQVIRACVARSLFNKRVFDTCRVLTSVGIQRRYLRIVAKNRLVIPLIMEYWVLPDEEIPPDTLSKCTFKSINGEKKSIFRTENNNNSTDNSTNKTIQNKTDFSPARMREEAPTFGRFRNVRLFPDEYEALKKEIPDADAYIEAFSEKLESKGYVFANHFATILAWYRDDKSKSRGEVSSGGKSSGSMGIGYESSFDIDDVWAAALKRTYGEDWDKK